MIFKSLCKKPPVEHSVGNSIRSWFFSVLSHFGDGMITPDNSFSLSVGLMIGDISCHISKEKDELWIS